MNKRPKYFNKWKKYFSKIWDLTFSSKLKKVTDTMNK